MEENSIKPISDEKEREIAVNGVQFELTVDARPHERMTR